MRDPSWVEWLDLYQSSLGVSRREGFSVPSCRMPLSRGKVTLLLLVPTIVSIRVRDSAAHVPCDRHDGTDG